MCIEIPQLKEQTLTWPISRSNAISTFYEKWIIKKIRPSEVRKKKKKKKKKKKFLWKMGKVIEKKQFSW